MIGMSASYSAAHQRLWHAHPSAWDKLRAKDPFDGWTRGAYFTGDVRVDQSLKLSLECLWAREDAYAQVFLVQTIQIADRCLAEDKFQDHPMSEQAYPRNFATVLQGRAYASWLLGEPLAVDVLKQAAELLRTWCLTKSGLTGRSRSDIDMNDYLRAVRTAFVAGDVAVASDYLTLKAKFRWHHAIERALWTKLITQVPSASAEFRLEFEEFFDRVRDPEFPEAKQVFISKKVLALESGMIRQKYLVNSSPDDPLDPKAVIAAVAA